MKTPDLKPQELDRLFDTARTGAPDPSDAFLSLLEDQAVATLSQDRARSAATEFSWTNLGALLGGWRGLAGLATATAVGVWLGIAPPAVLIDPVDALELAWFDETEGFGTGFGFGATEWVMSEDG